MFHITLVEDIMVIDLVINVITPITEHNNDIKLVPDRRKAPMRLQI